MSFQLNLASIERMRMVHPDLQALARLASLYSEVDFIVTEGARTRKRQALLVETGASWTMDSRHLLDDHNQCYALDVAAWVDGGIRWDWPLYPRINDAFSKASDAFKIPYIWGGNWKVMDGCHFELPRDKYPPFISDKADPA